MARLCAWVLIGLALLMMGDERARAANVLAGFASGDITPPLNLEMAGFGPALDRRATGIHDPLMAHAVVLEANGKRLAVVDCDVVGVTLDLTHTVRTQVEADTGIPGEHILVSATHTHSGPAIPKWADWGARDESYLKGLPRKIAQVVIAAAKNLQAVEVYYAEVPVEGIGENREYPDGPVDKAMRVLEFKHGDKTMGFIVNYSVHNVVFSELMHVYTADLTGVGVAKVLQDYPGAVGIYLQGSCGDINPKSAHGISYAPPAQCEQLLDRLSDLFAGYVRQALRTARRVEVEQIDMQTKPLILPEVPTDRALVLRQMQLADQLLGHGAGTSGDPALPLEAQRWLRFSRDSARAVLDRFNRTPLDEKTSEMQVLRIQDVLILTDPAELFMTFANQIAEKLPAWKVWVAGYANDYVGYIPSADRYDLSAERFSYPAYFTPMMNGEFRFRDDVGSVLVKNLVEMAQAMTAQ